MNQNPEPYKNVFTRTNCRFCDSENIKKFLDFGMMPLANNFLNEEKENQKYPLRFSVCNDCGLVQVVDIISNEVLFKDYRYTSSTTNTIREHFKNYANEIMKKYLNKNSFVVEIGSNDGVMLEPFNNLGIKALGVEPATNIAKLATDKGLDVLNDFFSVKTAQEISEKYGKADAIIGNNVLAHMDNMNEMFEGIKLLLSPKGILVFEIQYLYELVKNVQYDVMYHEHMSYYSVKPLISFLKKHGLKLFDVKEVPTHGGSIRVFGTHSDNEDVSVSQNVFDMLNKEKELGIHDYEGLTNFSKKVESHKEKIIELLENFKSQGKTICGYGAAGRGTIFVNFCGIDKKYLDYTVDDSHEKQGRFVPGTLVKILPVKHFREYPTDVLLMVAWTYKDEILTKENWFLKQGGKIIIPFPEPEVL